MRRTLAIAAAALACTAFGTVVIAGQNTAKVKNAVSWHSAAPVAVDGARW